MERLVECVPNVSEGHDVATLDAISATFDRQAGVWLLDRTSDPDHERSVFTVVGHPEGVRTAMANAVGVALERIDMRTHRGQHPRMGAVDVIPFIPLAGVTMGDCVREARTFAADIAERFALPVYLYAEAAHRHERRILADIRRPGFERLSAAMLEPDGAPDVGPSQPHASAGAVAVGARPFLIAFNIQLATSDLAVARRLAGRIRERDGGLHGVQALGIELASQGLVQLSMNILDHERMPLWRVWEEAQRVAAGENVTLLGSELIGLAPVAALLEVADHIGAPLSDGTDARIKQAGEWLAIRGAHPGMALERRLAAVRSA